MAIPTINPWIVKYIKIVAENHFPTEIAKAATIDDSVNKDITNIITPSIEEIFYQKYEIEDEIEPTVINDTYKKKP